MERKYIGELIAKRKALKLSQRALAQKCNIPQSTIGRIETGAVTPNLRTLKKINDVLDRELNAGKKTESPIGRWDGLEMLCFWKDELVSYVKVNGNKAKVQRIVNHPVKQIFTANELDVFTLSRLLESRCWQKDCRNIDRYLKKLSLPYYDPLEIVKKTHGVSYNDFLWFKFNGERLEWKDVAPKRFRNV